MELPPIFFIKNYIETLLNRHSVKSRLESTEGLSFTEFTYQALQAHDWAHLHATKRCLVQLGGSDQLGNMVAGQEVLQGEQCWGVLLPLITDEAGNKFGKSAGVDISFGLPFLKTCFPMQVLRFGWISPKLRCLNFTNSLFASPMPWLDLSCASSLSSLIKKWRRWRRNIERNLSCVLAKLPLHSRWTIWSKDGMRGSGNFFTLHFLHILYLLPKSFTGNTSCSRRGRASYSRTHYISSLQAGSQNSLPIEC